MEEGPLAESEKVQHVDLLLVPLQLELLVSLLLAPLQLVPTNLILCGSRTHNFKIIYGHQIIQ